MDALFERLAVRAATIDELLSDDFEALPGQKGDTDRAARRLAAWCRACSSGDWSLFARRLERENLTFPYVLERFANARRRASAPRPDWIDDAIWIVAAMCGTGEPAIPDPAPEAVAPCPFEPLFAPVVERAEAMLAAGLERELHDSLVASARTDLRHLLLEQLSGLCAQALYELFVKAVRSSGKAVAATSRYDDFIVEMRQTGVQRLFEEKPVLLRLIASLTRQWIDAWREFVLRLDADMGVLRRELLGTAMTVKVSGISGEVADTHNRGRAVRIVSFEDGGRVVYKPKDLRLDAAWFGLIEGFNKAGPPLNLKAVRPVARDGYGWTEFIEHDGCGDPSGFGRFFRRAGAWLALFHCFAATDMHQENMIASGDHPVPIDLEMLLQASADEHDSGDPENEAVEAAREIIAGSVSAIGLLPAYGRSPDNKIVALGGMNSDWNARMKLRWSDINSDRMRPFRSRETTNGSPNLPHCDGSHAKFGDHIEQFVAGFEDYAKFLVKRVNGSPRRDPADGFAGLPVRKVVRPTRFYFMLLQRLRDPQSMDDGVLWSAQADFGARLADADTDSDVLWSLLEAERSALVQLNVPYFVSAADGGEIRDQTGVSVPTEATPGVDRARARFRGLDDTGIAWQIEVIRQNTSALSTSDAQTVTHAGPRVRRTLRPDVTAAPPAGVFVAEADRIAAELAGRAIRKGQSAAWVGVDWLGDSEVSQLVPLGLDLYNGVSGIALFLAAHAAIRGDDPSRELALAALSSLRKKLRGRNAARLARSLGLGGATGLGSIIYALTVIAKFLDDPALLADARDAAELFTDDLIAADKQLDVVGGAAGGILALLRLYRDTQAGDVLAKASRCGEHLLRQRRTGAVGRRSWSGLGSPPEVNGMSHGAAGFAFAMASLAAATGRDEFDSAAAECIAFENATFDPQRDNWPDLRGTDAPSWRCQWCHGAPGIGLARIAMSRRRRPHSGITTDIRHALAGVQRGWPGPVDTLCCGTLGNIEFLREAADALDRPDLRELASRRLLTVLETAASAGDYRWNTGNRRFNLGLFRGIAGVGYAALRQADPALPDILIWD